jgi:hypothetical protein
MRKRILAVTTAAALFAVVAAPAAAEPMKPKAQDAGGPHSHCEGDELA